MGMRLLATLVMMAVMVVSVLAVLVLVAVVPFAMVDVLGGRRVHFLWGRRRSRRTAGRATGWSARRHDRPLSTPRSLNASGIRLAAASCRRSTHPHRPHDLYQMFRVR